MQWTRRDAYTMQRGPWRVCETLTHGVPCYTLTHDAMTSVWCGVRTHKILGVFDTFEQAKSKADESNQEGNDDE